VKQIIEIGRGGREIRERIWSGFGIENRARALFSSLPKHSRRSIFRRLVKNKRDRREKVIRSNNTRITSKVWGSPVGPGSRGGQGGRGRHCAGISRLTTFVESKFAKVIIETARATR
jgi:hypothetical protein